MNSQRNLLVIALLFVSFIIWQIWEKEYAQKFLSISMNANSLEDMNNEKKVRMNRQEGQVIIVKTDVLLLQINTCGGDIEQAYLLTYPDKLGSNYPIHLLKTSEEFLYQAQSGLTGRDGPDNPVNNKRPIYTTNQYSYVLSDDQNELHIPLIYIDNNGLVYTKTFIFKRGDFSLNIVYSIRNTLNQPLELSMFGQFKQTIDVPQKHNNNSRFELHTYRGVAYSTTEDKYRKYSFKEIKKRNLNICTRNGWIAILQPYFFTAWIPSSDLGKNTFYTNTLNNNNQVIVGFKSQKIIIFPGSHKYLKATLWIGPKIQDKMAVVTPYLDLVVDYGWLWFISQPLFKLLRFINSYISNWGFSIIIITFIVRGIMYPLTKAQYTSMAKIRMLQPKLITMREKLGDDKKRQSQEMMALYKSEKVNPLGGCLPIIIQMPIFLALYYMLSGSVELRHAPFALWIHDLSAQDPYYILPILMGITMFCIQKMTPATVADPIQQKIITFFPVIFTIFFLWFPSGLVLYYTVSNLVSIVQQKIIFRSLEKRGLHNRDKKTK